MEAARGIQTVRRLGTLTISFCSVALSLRAQQLMVTPGPNAPSGVFARVGPSAHADVKWYGFVQRRRLLASGCAPPAAGWCKVTLPDRTEAFASAEYLEGVRDRFKFEATFLDVGGGQAAIFSSGL